MVDDRFRPAYSEILPDEKEPPAPLHRPGAEYFAAHGILAVERVMTDNHWSKRHVFTSNAECAAALAPWLEGNNTCRRHSALGGLPSISRL